MVDMDTITLCPTKKYPNFSVTGDRPQEPACRWLPADPRNWAEKFLRNRIPTFFCHETKGQPLFPLPSSLHHASVRLPRCAKGMFFPPSLSRYRTDELIFGPSSFSLLSMLLLVIINLACARMFASHLCQDKSCGSSSRRHVGV